MIHNHHEPAKIIADDQNAKISGCIDNVLEVFGEVVVAVLDSFKKKSWVHYMSLISLIDALLHREIMEMPEKDRDSFLDAKNKTRDYFLKK